jgi:hypothetical protein
MLHVQLLCFKGEIIYATIKGGDNPTNASLICMFFQRGRQLILKLKGRQFLFAGCFN